MEGSSGEAFSSEIWDWAFDQIPKVAARYRDVESVELEAELARQLLELRRKPTVTPRDWKAYLIKCLLNGASRFARQWRQRCDREPSIEATSPTREHFEQPAESGKTLDAAKMLAAFQRRLGNADRRLLKELRECRGNVSLLARRRGEHRNTIHRRLRRIRRAGCPIEIETAPGAAGETPFEREDLLTMIRAPETATRQAYRARMILDLQQGLTYNEIVRRYGTSRSTIARWRPRFIHHGIRGLKAKHRGKKPSPRQARLAKHLRETPVPKRPSVRQLAQQFGVGKSTAQRILKLHRDGALSGAKTL